MSLKGHKNSTDLETLGVYTVMDLKMMHITQMLDFTLPCLLDGYFFLFLFTF
jgi:hypothetical protein